MDLLIKNGTIVTAKGSYKADEPLRTVKLQQSEKTLKYLLLKLLTQKANLYCRVLLMFTHSGNAVWRNSSADSYLSGTRAAACGGVTTVFDYPVQHSGETIWDLSIQKKLCLKKRLV